MSSDEVCTPPPAKQPNIFPSVCEIGDLSDADLAEIFKRLPPYDRLITTEVCKHCRNISEKAWLDIIHLDLSPIPGPNIAAIIRQCPNLRTVSAVRKTFAASELHILSRISLMSLSLYECSAVIVATGNIIPNPLPTIFSGNLRSANWEELVLHDLRVKIQGTGMTKSQLQFPACFPSSLKRLQVSGVRRTQSANSPGCDGCAFLPGLRQLKDLECLILHSTALDEVIHSAFEFKLPGKLAECFAPLKNLRELHLSYQCGHNLKAIVSCLPQLEALFVHCLKSDFDAFTSAAIVHPSLRILVFTENVHPQVEFPARVLFPNGYNADPLPELNIFVGRRAALKIRFPTFPLGAAKVHPITKPLPEFLEREDIKAIFKGVWIAEKIKEAAKHGAELYFYKFDVASAACFVDG